MSSSQSHLGFRWLSRARASGICGGIISLSCFLLFILCLPLFWLVAITWLARVIKLFFSFLMSFLCLIGSLICLSALKSKMEVRRMRLEPLFIKIWVPSFLLRLSSDLAHRFFWCLKMEILILYFMDCLSCQDILDCLKWTARSKKLLNFIKKRKQFLKLRECNIG